MGVELQRGQTWGNTLTYAFDPSTGLTLAPQSVGTLVSVMDADEAIAWLVQWTVQTSGFAGETQPLTVALRTTAGSGQTNSQIIQPRAFVTPDYADVVTFFDQGQVPSQSLLIDAVISGGPFSVPGHHSVTVSAWAAPFTGRRQAILDAQYAELQALRGELRDLTRVISQLGAHVISRGGR